MSNSAQKRVPTFSAVYTIAEAARLCVLPPAQVHRWIRNSFTLVHTTRRVGKHGDAGLDFLDLIEIRFVKAFLDVSVTWHVLRAGYERMAAMLRVDHPFATKKFFADGPAVLKSIAEPVLLEAAESHVVFSGIEERYFGGRESLDFNDDNMAARWWPVGRKRLVVIDPERSFGQPIVSMEGVPTAVLYKAYVAESVSARNGKKVIDDDRPDARKWTPEGGKPAAIMRFRQSPSGIRNTFDKVAIARVADWYVVEERSVRAAIEYEADFLSAA